MSEAQIVVMAFLLSGIGGGFLVRGIEILIERRRARVRYIRRLEVENRRLKASLLELKTKGGL